MICSSLRYMYSLLPQLIVDLLSNRISGWFISNSWKYVEITSIHPFVNIIQSLYRIANNNNYRKIDRCSCLYITILIPAQMEHFPINHPCNLLSRYV